MDYSHALQRLRNHAIVAGSTFSETESFVFALWQAERESRTPDIRILCDDILSCLEVVNRELNTQHPSENISGKAKDLPRFLVADLSAILSVGWRNASSNLKLSKTFRDELASVLMKIGIAWDAVLAGDIDCIREEVDLNFFGISELD
jgi:hypothetical protein